jgi:hypothetical protein
MPTGDVGVAMLRKCSNWLLKGMLRCYDLPPIFKELLQVISIWSDYRGWGLMEFLYFFGPL